MSFYSQCNQLIESTSKEETWVVLLKHKYGQLDKNGVRYAGKILYQFKPEKDISQEDKDIIKKLEPSHAYMGTGFGGFDIDGYEEIFAFIGPESLAKEEFRSVKEVYGPLLKQEIPLKKETRKHFGDVVDALNETVTSKFMMPIDIIIKSIKQSKDSHDGSLMFKYIIRLKDPGPAGMWTDIEVFERPKEPPFRDIRISFADIKDSYKLGPYDMAYRTSFRWYNIYQKDILKAIKREKRIKELKPKTQKHFGDVIGNLDESSGEGDMYILFINISRAKKGKEGQSNYTIKRLNDLSGKERKDLKSKYEEYHSPGIKKAYDIKIANRSDYFMQVAFIDNRKIISDIIQQYKISFPKLKNAIKLKPETEKHFGDVLTSLDEKKEEKWAYLIKIGRKKDGTEFARYKFLPYDSLSEEDFAIADQLYDYTNTYAHGRYEGRDDIRVYVNGIKNKIDGYRTILFYVGSKSDLQAEFESDKKYQYGTRMEPEIQMKPETKRHFGDVVDGLE